MRKDSLETVKQDTRHFRKKTEDNWIRQNGQKGKRGGWEIKICNLSSRNRRHDMKWKAVAEEMSIGEEKKTAFNTYTTVSCNVMLKLKIQSNKRDGRRVERGRDHRHKLHHIFTLHYIAQHIYHHITQQNSVTSFIVTIIIKYYQSLLPKADSKT